MASGRVKDTLHRRHASHDGFSSGRTVRRGDEHQVSLSAVSPCIYGSYIFNHGAHRANEHQGQPLLNRESVAASWNHAATTAVTRL